MNWIKLPFYIYLLLKPYYITKSGSIQPGDFFLIISVLLFFIFRPKEWVLTKFERKNLNRLILFILYAITVNLVYLIMYPTGDFYVYIQFYVFNLTGLIVFTYLITDKKFLKFFYNIQCLNLVIQTIILVSGHGKSLGNIRYMGTFNDPNQFSFYMFLSLISIYILEDLLPIKNRRWIVYLAGIFLIVSSASIGMLLGLIVFFFAVFVSEFKFTNKRIKSFSKLIILLFVLGLGTYFSNKKSIEKKVSYVILRVEEKINSTNDHAKISIAEDRGYDKLYKNAEYLILGSGEGEFSRLKGFHSQEVHATFPGLFLYYGIPGLFLIVAWLYNSLIDIPLNQKLVFMALFLESLTLAHQRQLLFWGVIILMSKVKNSLKIRNSD